MGPDRLSKYSPAILAFPKTELAKYSAFLPPLNAMNSATAGDLADLRQFRDYGEALQRHALVDAARALSPIIAKDAEIL